MNSGRFSQFISHPGPPELGPGPRAKVQTAADLNRQLDEALPQAGLTATRAEMVRATVLLWHDHFDAAHAIAQNIETPDGSYVHAILHRREPDYGNAKYWFRRVGVHPCYDELAKHTSAMLKAKGEAELERRLLPRGQWDAFAFVDACEAAASEPPDPAWAGLLREIQRMEFEILLDHLASEGSHHERRGAENAKER